MNAPLGLLLCQRLHLGFGCDTALAYSGWLWALDSVVDRMGDKLRGEPLRWNTPTMITFGLFLAAGFLAAWLAVRLAGYQDWRVRCNSPPRLFLMLCRAHRLRWSDRWLLWRLAKHRGLADPGELFLSPRLVDHADLGGAWRRHAGRLESLRKRLFGGLTTLRPQAPPVDLPGPTPFPTRDTLQQPAARQPASPQAAPPQTAASRSAASRPAASSDRPADADRPVNFPLGGVPQLDLPPWTGSQTSNT